MAEAVHKTGNGVLIDKYAQKTALRLGVTPDAVRAEFRKLSRARLRRPNPRSRPWRKAPPRSGPRPTNTGC